MSIQKMGCSYTMEYYPAIKTGFGTDTCYNTDQPQKHHAKWKKPSHKQPHTV